MFSILLLSSCNKGRLNRIGSFPLSLKESSAAEKVVGSPLIWTLEDSRNPTVLYGVNENGNIIREIKVINATNNDWEDLTSDTSGNIYIGDFGNNRKDRDSFIIYKISNLKNIKQHAIAELISFKLPPETKTLNFEAFFIYKKHFYLINKKNKKTMLFKVPNRIGNHTAEYVCSFDLDSEKQKITSADISNDGKTIVLLNSNMLWKITDFNTDDFCNATIENIAFNHFSQKEGVCFKDNNTIYITDERVSFIGGNIYTLKIGD
ncbi:SdiA-regulated domain-containing protein [Xanthomarina sp. F2636L]|nr:SdiA-regulated domain-containing protein [Xanthomarina sp. F2636L]